MAQHAPSAFAIADVVRAFANAPVSNPDGTTGIRLRVQVSDSVTENASLAMAGCTAAA